MITIATLGENVKRQYYPGKVRKKVTKGRPDLWGLGLLRSNAKRMRKKIG